ncbi:flagellar hook-basal body protein [Desulfotruncus alcoholivorax]|uniref:flagellar hook-basal body protein n=1 Tax=Desulfotruncus alcoholivorax TaxID=265477 RepID=UPI000421F0B8|nr:flagellar hook basal-body protein [Desulfotruncus alcoholivorax]
MIRLMSSGVSGMINHQYRMDVIGNNISNENTTGYKSSRATFKDALYQAMGSGGSQQVGTGVDISDISNNFGQGTLEPTGRTLDVAIQGAGFFGVTDSSGKLKFTRDGSFFFDKDGFLRNSSGLNVVRPDGEPINVPELKDREKVQISETGLIYKVDVDPATMEPIQTDLDQIGLFNFQNVSALTKTGDNLFLENDRTGERYSNEDGNDGFGTINSGYLEGSNLDIIEELAQLISTQRGYQANAKVFTTADEVLQDIIQLKR